MVSTRFILRLSALMTVLVLVCAEWFLNGEIPTASFMTCCILCGCMVLVFVPLCSEDLISGWMICAIAVVTSFSGYFAARGLDISCSFAVLAVSSFLLAGFFIYRSVRKFSLVRPLFQPEAVWNAVEEWFRFLYGTVVEVVIAVTSIALGLGFNGYLHCVLLALSTGLFVLLWARSRTGRTFFLTRRKERMIREAVSSSNRMTLPDSPEDEARMNSTYSRLLELMNVSKPYLRDTYYIDDMCTDLGVNKSYLSNVINVYSGRNYRQFINYYRIKYAIALMKEDPSQLIMEVALLCGFHSVVSFNMAFKLNMHMTPSEYLEKIRGKEVLSKTGEPDN